MSTYYLPDIPIPFSKVKGLNTSVIREVQTETTIPDRACLSDGKNYLWATRSRGGNTKFARYSANQVEDIISNLEILFGVRFVSEYEPEFSALVEQSYHQDYIRINLGE